MQESQFRILYKQFLFRMVDLELLSADARGDTSKLLGQFAALLVTLSMVLCVIGLGLLGAGDRSAGALFINRLAVQWSGVHFMIATTMLVVGLFAILSWDSTFPDRRDVMVLAPLPIRSRTIFFAKVAAVATALSITIVAMHSLAGFLWPLLLNDRHAAAPAPAIAYDRAVPPLAVAELEPVLKHDLDSTLRTGAFAPGTGSGATVGVWKHGQQRVFAYGTANPDSLFEIGSITKTFTGLALAQFVVQGKARLDEPVRELLPPNTVTHPRGKEITLLDLATHRSGLPTMPTNVHSTNVESPFADYGVADLYDFMKTWGVAQPPHAPFGYSSLGMALLGQALANRANVSYEDLLRGITEPLGMPDTVIHLSAEQRRRMIQGYTGFHAPVPLVNAGALAPAGEIRSTAADMLRYLTANLHPENMSRETGLRAALEFQHVLRAPIEPNASIALAWVHTREIYWHNGATPGYTADASFSPQGDYAVVVLTSAGPDLFGIASVLAEHVRERLTGEPAISLNTIEVPAGGGGLMSFLRVFAVWWVTMAAAGAFIYCCVLGAQGLIAELLPRRHFLRVSGYMQLAAFGIFVIAYFLEPKLVTPGRFIGPESSAYLDWSPSYWFLGLFQQLNGSPALANLAARAWIAIALAFGATASAYTLAYFRTIRRIVEEPDIAPASRGRSWLPRFGNGFTTAIGQFSTRTVLRSRQHRLLLAFYLGTALAAAILFVRLDDTASDPGKALALGPLNSTITIMILCVVGMRVVFSLPMVMSANWIFRITPTPEGPECITARRRALYALSVLPVAVGEAAVLFWIWPWQAAAKHVLVLVLLGTIIAELCLHGTQKLPFTCSYLPGKSNFNIAFLMCVMLFLPAIMEAVKWERDSFDHPARYAALVGALAALVFSARWSTTRLARSAEGKLQFEEAEEPAVLALNLDRGY
jgi:CubicO group peptidase (beta-lactamase class C family)